jgi:N-carbamoyl-L-amino-acid hydrolase
MTAGAGAELRIDEARLRADFEALSQFGATADGGVARTTFSEPYLAAREWLLGRARDAGLETCVDAAGNHSAVLPAAAPAARTLMLGSHLDTVVLGGRYDGALGVLCALEVLRTLKEAGLELPLTLEAIDFTDEEGTFVGVTGSLALTGALTSERLENPRPGRRAWLEALERAGLTEDGMISGARRDPSTIAGYLELHIEQGPFLERDGIDIGVVTSIEGSCWFRFHFTGEARHAGATPMGERHDAAVGAAAFVLGVRETVTAMYPECVATCGNITVGPGSFNIVPGTATVSVEARSHDPDEHERLQQALIDRGHAEAERWGLTLDVERVGRWPGYVTDPSIRSAFSRAAAELGLSSVEMRSNAGHDAMILGQTAPAGMVFVPSVGGVSHHPSELTKWDDCVNGANVLLRATMALARSL